MTRQVEAARPYIQLVNEELVTASDKQWSGFYPELNAYCKCYYTSPHLTSKKAPAEAHDGAEEQMT